ncbi:hypothetical protein DL767_001551 [Monosporascus sp. MG133]|nr:hypothetical protein DL767_001551 [Monosporascus sp. MG133]
MQFPSTLLLTALGGHVAALPSNALLSPQRTSGLTVTITLSSAKRGDERQGLNPTQEMETDSSCRPVGRMTRPPA